MTLIDIILLIILFSRKLSFLSTKQNIDPTMKISKIELITYLPCLIFPHYKPLIVGPMSARKGGARGRPFGHHNKARAAAESGNEVSKKLLINALRSGKCDCYLEVT